LYRKDYFVCHASSDKETYARPLARALERAGMTCWIDEAEILPGDSITRAIDRGLVESQYVIVLITPAFLTQGQWRFYELRTALAQQITSGSTKIVPIVATLSEEDLATLADELPGLLDRSQLRWESGTDYLVGALERRLGRIASEYWEHYHRADYRGPVWVSVVATPAEVGADHHVTIGWGTWEWRWRGVLPSGRGPIAFRHHKAVDVDDRSHKLRVDVQPAAVVRFGIGEPPTENVIETGPWSPRS
jgi:hypothetical protein